MSDESNNIERTIEEILKESSSLALHGALLGVLTHNKLVELIDTLALGDL